MALAQTINHVRSLLGHITADLVKAENGNKAAAQRVRTGTVKLEKLAKAYRKESIATEKKGGVTKKPAKKAAHKPAAKKAVHHKPAAKKAAHKPAAKKVTKAKSSALSVKRPTAKLPSKKRFGLK